MREAAPLRSRCLRDQPSWNLFPLYPLPLTHVFYFTPSPSYSQLSMRVRDYHETARSLQLIPLGAKWSGGRDWSLRIDERALDRVHAPDYGSRGSADLKQAAYALLGCEDFKVGVVRTGVLVLVLV